MGRVSGGLEGVFGGKPIGELVAGLALLEAGEVDAVGFCGDLLGSQSGGSGGFFLLGGFFGRSALWGRFPGRFDGCSLGRLGSGLGGSLACGLLGGRGFS